MVNHKIDSILRPSRRPSALEDRDELSATYDLSSKGADIIAEILSDPVADILSDLPTGEDAFGFKGLVRTISNIASSKNTQTPLTICVDGKWGSGKTSFLKMIETQAKILGFSCIWLNAWKLEKTEDFLLSFSDALLREFNLYEDINDSDDIIYVASPLRQQIWDWTESPFRVSFSDVIKKLLKSKENSGLVQDRLLIFVDDIDRAFPEQITMILKNLKLLLESEGCVFFLAMDLDTVAKSLEKIYLSNSQNTDFVVTTLNNTYSEGAINLQTSASKDERNQIAQEFGYSYLEKLIQLHVKLPKLTWDAICEYLVDIGVVDEIIEIVQYAPEDILNPRRLKRYINWLSISLQLIGTSPLPAQISRLSALQFLALRHDYPNIYYELVKHFKFSSEEDPPIDDEINNYDASDELKQHILNLPLDQLLEFETFLSKTPVLSAARMRV